MLKHCVQTMFGNKGEGLLQACISSNLYIVRRLLMYQESAQKFN